MNKIEQALRMIANRRVSLRDEALRLHHRTLPTAPAFAHAVAAMWRTDDALLQDAAEIVRATKLRRRVYLGGTESQGPWGGDVGFTDEPSSYRAWVYQHSFPLGSHSRVEDYMLRSYSLVGLKDPSALRVSHDVIEEPSESDLLATTDAMRENHICRQVGSAAAWFGRGPWSMPSELVGGLERLRSGDVRLIPARRSSIAWLADDDLKDYRTSPSVMDDEDADAELVEGVDFTWDPSVRTLPLAIDVRKDGTPVIVPRLQAPVNIGGQQERVTQLMLGGDPLSFADEEASEAQIEQITADDGEIEREGAGMIEDFADSSYDPQVGRQARAVVKRGTHLKPQFARPVGSMIPSWEQAEILRLEPVREAIRDEVGCLLYGEGLTDQAFTVWEGDFDGTFLITGWDDRTIIEKPTVWFAPLSALPVWMQGWRERRRESLITDYDSQPFISVSLIWERRDRNTEALVNRTFDRVLAGR